MVSELRSCIASAALSLLTGCATTVCDLDAIYKQAAYPCDEAVCPPGTPQTGPGSGQSPHGDVHVTTLQDGWFDAYRSVIYTPAAPEPKAAPVVLFLHGYFDAKPEPYDAMLRHIARKGYIVVYPSYGNFLGPKDWANNAEEAFKRALNYLDEKSATKPNRDQVAYVGHSMGGILSLHLAEREYAATSAPIPKPRIIITLEAAGISTIAYPYVSIDDLSHIPASTKLFMIMAEETYERRLADVNQCENDNVETPSACNAFTADRRAFRRTAQIPAANKTAVLIPSDYRGKSGLRSEHNGAQGSCGWFSKPIDAIDTWGYWRYTAAALEQEFHHFPGSVHNLSSADFRQSGPWSDGQPAKAAILMDQCLSEGVCP